MRRPTLQDRVEYALARALEAGATALPAPAAERIGAAFGRLAHDALGIRRDVVERNLRRAFPAADEPWVRRTARASYRHLGREAVAMLRLSRARSEEVVRRTRMHGWDDLLAARARTGRGVLLVTGHFGNWELGAAAVAARGVPMAAVVKRQRNRLFDARLDRTRRRLGVETVDMGEATRRVPRLLLRGTVVGMVADQDARRSGIWVPFFGHPASTHRGPALFALRLDVPVFASAVTRGQDGGYDITLRRIPVERTDDLDSDVARLTRRLAESLEVTVRAAPEQYFWMHKRWKTRPPPELSSTGSGITDNAHGPDSAPPAP